MSEKIISTEYSSEMQQSFINYSMSVITDRAVPDVRDGLKPVQRRVLYTMYELGLDYDKPHRKSARIVGDTMGKYHPHGDSSIYESLVVMAQDFKKSMPLVDGHGNFGSIEGDGAAAMRYTEARLQKFTQDVFLADLDKNVVDFVPNFDDTETEPVVLPVKVPNVLINGSDGIAVGMTTSIAPHNLGEVIDAMTALLEHPKLKTKDLMKYLKGPDFPTGGIVTNLDDLLSIYETGTGKIRIRGKAEIVRGKTKSDHDKIVITEIPYPMLGANIGKFLAEVSDLAESHTFPDISDISNQSSKDGIRIVIDVKKGGDADNLLKGLYQKTKLEDTFSVSMLVIEDGKPQILGLKKILEDNIQFQIETNTRKYQTLLQKEKENQEIQEGLIKAVNVIDLIIEIVRGSRDRKTAKNCLINGDTTHVSLQTKTSQKKASKLNFTERQADAILNLRLERLIGLEVMALQKEHEETEKKITSYEKILSDHGTMIQTIRADLLKIKKEYAKPRKTQLCNLEEEIYQGIETPETDVVFSMNRFGYVKLYEDSVYQKNHQAIQDESRFLIPCKNTSKILLFTAEGKVYPLSLDHIPFCKIRGKGIPIDNLCRLNSTNETVICAENSADISKKRLIFITELGMVKKVDAQEFVLLKKVSASTKLSPDDKLVSILIAQETDVLLFSEEGTVIRLASRSIPEQKRNSVGVHGCLLQQGNRITAACAAKKSGILRINGKEYHLSSIKTKEIGSSLQKTS